MRRRLFLGDVQGCRDELERVLDKAGFDPATDELHPVGDFVNRGPDSLGALRLLRDLGAGGVLGNHDLHLLHAAAGMRRVKGRDTIQDVLDAPDREELLAWLAARPFVRVWDDLYLVHAGIHPAWTAPLAVLRGKNPLVPDDDVHFAVAARACDSDGTMFTGHEDPAPAPYRPWHAFYDPARHGDRTVVFGHWAVQGLVMQPHLRGLDTGCVWGGKLSLWIAEEDRLVQVDAARAYCPVDG